MNVMFAMFGFGGWEVVLILAVVLLLFGAKKLPDLAKGLGTGIKEFKKATREVTEELQNAASDNSRARAEGAAGEHHRAVAVATAVTLHPSRNEGHLNPPADRQPQSFSWPTFPRNQRLTRKRMAAAR